MAKNLRMFLLLSPLMFFVLLTGCSGEGETPAPVASNGGGGAPGGGLTGSASLTWNPVSPPVDGYNVYVGTASQTYDPPVNMGNTTTATLNNLQPGNTYYFAVTAFNSAGESGFSPEVNKPIP